MRKKKQSMGEAMGGGGGQLLNIHQIWRGGGGGAHDRGRKELKKKKNVIKPFIMLQQLPAFQKHQNKGAHAEVLCAISAEVYGHNGVP